MLKLNTKRKIKMYGNIITLIISVVLLAMLYFIYKYTKERNPLGPTLETIFGIILLIIHF